VTIDNVDTPTMELSKSGGHYGLKFVGMCAWVACLATAGIKGRDYGTSEAKSINERVAQLAKSQEAERQRATAEAEEERRDLNAEEDRQSALEQAEQARLRSIEQAEQARLRSIDEAERARNNPIAEEERQRAYAREVQADRDRIIAKQKQQYADWEKRRAAINRIADENSQSRKSLNSTAVVPRAIPVGATAPEKTPIRIDTNRNGPVKTVTQDTLQMTDIDGRELQRVRYEINTIYARHGVVFPNEEIQSWAIQQKWYKAIPGRTFDEAEKLFTADERHDIEVLSARRDQFNQTRVNDSVLSTGRLDPKNVASWNATKIQLEINTIYAHYGIEFPTPELQGWANKQPWYKTVPGRTSAQVDGLLGADERYNIEILAARRAELKGEGK
jgi:hypothetical protein